MPISVKDALSAVQSLRTTTGTGTVLIPHYNLDTDTRIRIARGQVTGFSLVHCYGENTAVDTSEVDVWSTGGTVVYPAVAAAASIVSGSANDTSAGTGARTIKVTGINGSSALVTETVTMNGTTPVTSANSYLRILGAEVMTAGSGAANAAAITVSVGGNTQATIVTGVNKALLTHYTVPTGYTAYLDLFYASATVADQMQVTLVTRATSSVFKPTVRAVLYQKPEERKLYSEFSYSGGTDIVLRAKRLSGSGAVTVEAGYSFTLIQDSAT